MLQACVQLRLHRPHLLVRHPVHLVNDVVQHQFAGLENPERLLVQHVERANDAIVGGIKRRLPHSPGGVGEQQRRNDERSNHHDPQDLQCTVTRC